MQGFAATDLTDREIDEITHLNAMRFFQFDPFAIRPRDKCTVGALRAEATGHDVSIVAKGRRVEHDHPMTLAGFTALACLAVLFFALLRWRVNTPELHLKFGGLADEQPATESHE